MATYKFNLARIQGCPIADLLGLAMDEFGLPKTEEFGVLKHSVDGDVLFATIVRKAHQAITQVDEEKKEMVSTAVKNATVFTFAVKPSIELLEVYTGSKAAIEQVGMFFSGYLDMPTVTEEIPIDIMTACDKLRENTKRFQIVSARISDYAHNSYMIGPYTPKFLDSQHGVDFLTNYIEAVTAVNVRFVGSAGRINLKITPNACFSFSCNDEDESYVKSILRKLVCFQ